MVFLRLSPRTDINNDSVNNRTEYYRKRALIGWKTWAVFPFDFLKNPIIECSKWFAMPTKCIVVRRDFMNRVCLLIAFQKSLLAVMWDGQF